MNHLFTPSDDHPRRYAFVDPIHQSPCELVVPVGGSVFEEPKIGIAHPDCNTLADLSIELDAFYCQACRWSGRVSGAWCVDMIEDQRASELDEQ